MPVDSKEQPRGSWDSDTGRTRPKQKRPGKLGDGPEAARPRREEDEEAASGLRSGDKLRERDTIKEKWADGSLAWDAVEWTEGENKSGSPVPPEPKVQAAGSTEGGTITPGSRGRLRRCWL